MRHFWLTDDSCSLSQNTPNNSEDSKGGQETGADQVHWDLTQLYQGHDDPQIEADLERFERLAEQFRSKYRGQLNERLGDALRSYIELTNIGSKPAVYLMLLNSLDTTDQPVKSKMLAVDEKISFVAGQHLTFFELELAKLPTEDVDRQAETDETVRKHRPYIEKVQLFRDHQLTEEVEEALTKRQPFGPNSWATFFDEAEADLRVDLPDKTVTLTEALHLMTNSESPQDRAAILAAIDQTFSGPFVKLSAETLNNVVRAKALEDSERDYAHPMSERNLRNKMADEVVEALHAATAEVAAPLMKQHYQLKAAHLGLEKLAWSDRNADLPFKDKTVVPFAEAQQIVLDAFEAFSPTLADLVRETFAQNRVDAPATSGKRSGAFNMSWCLPGDEPAAYTFMNYQGSTRDVMTLAHELGHGVHGLLAGQVQGTLMMNAPMVYAETASIFGEMVTFRYLMDDLLKKGDQRSALALLHSKADDFANTVVRQISFSEFERQVHGAGRRLSAEEMNQIWLDQTYRLYGQPGEVFTYDHADRLWCYVGHFHRPFYVYAYATGELFTQSLFAVREQFGADFEPMYLDLLRAGGTKDATTLLKPFGLDPRDPEFWKRGIENSFGQSVAEAIRLSEDTGIKI